MACSVFGQLSLFGTLRHATSTALSHVAALLLTCVQMSKPHSTSMSPVDKAVKAAKVRGGLA
jgi:hypothetical protein